MDNKLWAGQRGRITPEIISKYLLDSNETDCYLCGPLEFVRSIETHLIELKIKKEKIKKEIYE
jgi:NAD(P)H-flavin reductase